MNFDIVAFDPVMALKNWGAIIALALLVLGVFSFALSLLSLGLSGPVAVLRQVGSGLADWVHTSPRRLWALSLLTIRESIRKKTLLVFVVFAILFLFAGWFISNANPDPRLQVKVYVAIVLKAMSWLILPIVLLLSCWGLPDDIKARSLHTVVTKPVRRHEVVLGRIFGFSLVGLFVLVIMGAVGYVWIRRQVPARAMSQLVARVPIYGSITFRSRQGQSADAGVNTGDTWMFRSYIEGGTKARAIWEFSDPLLTQPAESLKLESNFNVFRIQKGIVEEGILAQLVAVNDRLRVPLTLVTNGGAPAQYFEVSEFRENVHMVPREQKDENGKTVDLFTDVIKDGKLKIEAVCLTSSQFLGVARPDLFIRLPDRSFLASYAKGVLGIGIMMVMVVVLGVISSCFLKGPVATLLTFFVLLIGRVGRAFLDYMTTDPTYRGGSVFESVYRIGRHLNPDSDLSVSMGTQLMRGLDALIMAILSAIRYVFPDFATFNMIDFVANGYDVPWRDSILPSVFLMVGYIIPWILIGQFSLKLRELETR